MDSDGNGDDDGGDDGDDSLRGEASVPVPVPSDNDDDNIHSVSGINGGKVMWSRGEGTKKGKNWKFSCAWSMKTRCFSKTPKTSAC